MSDDPIHLSLSRADAERLRLAITRMSGVNYVHDAEGEPWEMSWDAVAALDAALAAGPAPEPTIHPSDELLAAMSRYVQLATERGGQPTYEANVRGGWMVISVLCGNDDRLLLWAHEMTTRRIRAVHRAMAAPAEGPERAATGETGYYVGVDAFGQKVRVPNNVHFTDSRKRKRAAIGGGGEGDQ